MRSYYLIITMLLFAACDPSLPNGKITCDPRSTDQCPRGYVCMKADDGIYKCYNEYDGLGYCGDRLVQPDFEQCDIASFQPTTCTQMGYYDPNGTNATEVVCNSDCVWGTDVCDGMGKCGDGDIQTTWGEECEGYAEQGCTEIDPSFTMGFTSCTDTCVIDDGYCYESLEKKIDVLFVVDDTSDPFMSIFRKRLKDAAPGLLNSMGMMPEFSADFDLHVGVVSNVLHIPNFCETTAANDGKLMRASECGITDSSYLAKSLPQNCTIERDFMTCLSHDCVQANCEGALQFYEDENGCPFCVNFPTTGTDPLGTAYSCLFDITQTKSCTMRQPLLAMEKAVDPELNLNPGFLRDDALLIVIFATNGDDCSIEDPARFMSVTGQFPLSPEYACVQGGVTCKEPFDNLTSAFSAEFTECAPRVDSKRTLFDMEHFVTSMRSTKGGKNILAISLAGDFDGMMLIERDDHDNIPLEGRDEPVTPENNDIYTVSTSCDGALPAVRLSYFVQRFGGRDSQKGIYSVCDDYYYNAFDSIYFTLNAIFSDFAPLTE